MRELGERPIPMRLRELHDRLEFQERMSRSRQESDCGEAQLDVDKRIGAAEAATILGWTKRQVQRLAADLDGEIVGGRWLFRQSTVTEYAEGRQGAQLAENDD